jgi:hypothetical protein
MKLMIKKMIMITGVSWVSLSATCVEIKEWIEKRIWDNRKIRTYETRPERRIAHGRESYKNGFFLFPNLFAICINTFKYNQQIVC